MFRSFEANSGTIQRKRGRLKKAVQQGRRAFGARSVHGVREHAKSRRTQLAAFFNIPRKGSEDLATPSTSAVDQSNLGQAPELARTFVIQLLFLGLRTTHTSRNLHEGRRPQYHRRQTVYMEEGLWDYEEKINSSPTR